MLKEQYSISRIDNAAAQALIVEHHYLHRKAPCTFAFGLLDNSSGEICGVVMYGTPSSSTLRRGLAGDEHINNVIELTRLWVKDGVERNAASFLIGGTIRQVNKEYVVSYADTSVGHVGYVYQATNWLYTGLSAKRTDWKLKGYEGHSQTLSDKYKAAELREMYGSDFSLVPRPRKHRYVFINAKGKRKDELRSLLQYPIEPYPKG